MTAATVNAFPAGKALRPQPIKASELMARKFEEPPWAVPGLIPEGLFLIAARPKMGTSWLMLNLSVAVAAGGRALGQMYVTEGDVLYLALEDTERRLQMRPVTMLEDGAEAPDALELMTRWPRLDAGGLDAIGDWLSSHTDARLVVVDTFAKVRRRERSRQRDVSMYDEDYEALAGLKRLADEHGVAIGVVHHQRKMSASDPLDTVSGTLGLTAGPDTILVLERTRGDADAVLHVTGRDLEEAKHPLRWDPHVGTWSLLTSIGAELSPPRAEVLNALAAHPKPMRPSDVADWTGRPKGAIRKLMWEMAGEGQLGGDGIGGYYLPVYLPRESNSRIGSNSGNAGNRGNGHV